MANDILRHTSIDIPAEQREQLAKILNQVLADLTDLASQTRQAHWNVRGSFFYSLHKLFDDLTDSVEGYLDSVAERVTALGGLAQGTVRLAAGRSQLKELPTNLEGDLEFVQALSERYAQITASVRISIENAQNLNDTGTADLLTGLSRHLDKSLWLLDAHEVGK